MSKEVIKSASGKLVELIHRDSDPSMWIVNVYKKVIFFKKRISSKWFSDKEEALQYVKSI